MWPHKTRSTQFCRWFPEFLIKILSIFFNYIKIFENSVFIFKDKEALLIFWFNFFAEFLVKYFTNPHFYHQKLHKMSFFSLLWLNLPEVHTECFSGFLKPRTQSFYTTKGTSPKSTFNESALKLTCCRFLLILIDDYQKRKIEFWFLLKNYLSISETFEIIKGSNWTNIVSKASLSPILDFYNPKLILIIISPSF